MAAAQESPRPQLALMGTVPIYWGEAEGLAGLLDTSDTGHWARPVLEQEFDLVPLDYLSADVLAQHTTLMMAQPRALSAEENVALDAWVRSPLPREMHSFVLNRRRRLGISFGRLARQALMDVALLHGHCRCASCA
jgi:hypothetical protein